MQWIPAILAIGLLIVVHEAGHYLVARWCGMRVERFSVGFGPAVASRRSKKTGTIFQITPIPFGGFVEIKGMNIAEDVDPDDAEAYPNRPAWQRFVTIFAGPATNYVAAIVLALLLFSTFGIASKEHWYGVGELKDGYDAAKVLKVDDRIIAVNGKALWAFGPNGEQDTVFEAINAHQPSVDPHAMPAKGTRGRPVDLTVERDGKQQTFTLTPTFDPDLGKKKNGDTISGYVLGIGLRDQYDRVHVGPIGVVTAAFEYPIDKTKMIVVGLYQFATGQVEGEVEGPVGMASMVHEAFTSGWVTALELVMLLNVYLGLFNLLPLPALDGGRLVFLVYEMATRRRANPRVETTVHMVGILILLVIMVLVTFKDCVNLF